MPTKISIGDILRVRDSAHVLPCDVSHTVKPDPNRPSGINRGTRLFIKGPIPFLWLQKANGLGGSTGVVATGLWFYAGIHKSRRFRIDRRLDQLCGLTRQTRNIVLGRLQSHGLIVVSPKRGAYPTVEILERQK